RIGRGRGVVRRSLFQERLATQHLIASTQFFCFLPGSVEYLIRIGHGRERAPQFVEYCTGLLKDIIDTDRMRRLVRQVSEPPRIDGEGILLALFTPKFP